MKISKTKLELAMARNCISREALRPVLSAGTLDRISKGTGQIRPVTAGKLAKALGVDVTEILAEEERK